MNERMETAPRKQSRRVAAWIYAVINPIVDSLLRESTFFKSGNLTWRSPFGRCEFIKPIQDYVDSRQWPNYFDYLAEHSLFSKTFQEHDSDLSSVNSGAKEAFDFLISSKGFLDEVGRLLNSYESQRGTMGPQYPSFNNSRAELPKMAAENVINNIQGLPSHYMFAPFWNSVGSDLITFRAHSVFAPLLASAARLSEISSALRGGLEEHRLSLSREFDVPAAPVPGLSFDS